MVIKCISSKPTQEQKKMLPLGYENSEFHISPEKSYIVFGLSFMLHSDHGRCCMVEIISDYEHLTHAPLFLFNVVDPRISKYWSLKVIDDFTIVVWPDLFNRDYFHDDLSENVPEVVSAFLKLRKLIEVESTSATSF